MMRLMGRPTRETNSSHAASSRGPAQRQTTSLSDSDEYRVDLEVFDMLSPVRIVGAVRKVTGQQARKQNLMLLES